MTCRSPDYAPIDDALDPKFVFLHAQHAGNIVHTGDLDATLSAVRACDPVAVVAGGEVGVEFADLLGERLGLPTNGTALSAARRDKYVQIETLRAAGLRATRQLLVEDAAQLAGWHAGFGAEIRPNRRIGIHGDYRYTFLDFGDDDDDDDDGGGLIGGLLPSHNGSMWTVGFSFYF